MPSVPSPGASPLPSSPLLELFDPRTQKKNTHTPRPSQPPPASPVRRRAVAALLATPREGGGCPLSAPPFGCPPLFGLLPVVAPSPPSWPLSQNCHPTHTAISVSISSDTQLSRRHIHYTAYPSLHITDTHTHIQTQTGSIIQHTTAYHHMPLLRRVLILPPSQPVPHHTHARAKKQKSARAATANLQVGAAEPPRPQPPYRSRSFEKKTRVDPQNCTPPLPKPPHTHTHTYVPACLSFRAAPTQ